MAILGTPVEEIKFKPLISIKPFADIPELIFKFKRLVTLPIVEPVIEIAPFGFVLLRLMMPVEDDNIVPPEILISDPAVSSWIDPEDRTWVLVPEMVIFPKEPKCRFPAVDWMEVGDVEFKLKVPSTVMSTVFPRR